MGQVHSKGSRRNGSIKLVVYSVCGHSEERRYGEVAAVVGNDLRHCLLGVGEGWLPKNTECRAGWCPACFVHYRRHQLAIVNETVIENYWDYLARHQWTRPVEPGQVRIDALRATNNSSSSQRRAHEAVAACLYSLRLGASSSTWSCRPSGGPRTLAAATSIREGTLAWTAQVRAEAQSRARQAYRDYLSSKPLPRIPRSDEREYHLSWNPSPFAASQQHNRGGEDTRVSVLQALNTAIDETLQASERLALMAAERDHHHSSKTTTPAARHGRFVRAQDNDLIMSSPPLPTSTAGSSSGFRTPSHRTPSPPPRPSRTMARCQRHGHVDPARVVDMSCDLCARLGLVESTVPVGSPLGLRPCDFQFLDVGAQQGVLAAMHGTCCCGNEGPCVSCLARRDFAVRTGVAWI